jgi:hypothetical protein
MCDYSSSNDCATIAGWWRMVKTSLAHYWDRFVGTHIKSPDHWEANEVYRQTQWQFITEDPFQKPIDWFMNRLGPLSSMASICSGSSLLEKHIGTHYVGRIDGYDVSPGSLEHARKFCASMSGVHFHVADVNTAVWGADHLDSAFANGAMHRAVNLYQCLSQFFAPRSFLDFCTSATMSARGGFSWTMRLWRPITLQWWLLRDTLTAMFMSHRQTDQVFSKIVCPRRPDTRSSPSCG